MAIYLKGWVAKCDFNGTTYDGLVEGAHLLVRGHRGGRRVIYVGPEFIAEHDIKVVDYDTATKMVEAMENSFVGF